MNEPKVKIFVGYYKPNKIYASDVFQPILTAPIDWDAEGIIRDYNGINIAEKNKNYAELTGHYWVWKNFLPDTKAEYVGFCHYRRFLDFGINKTPNVPFKPVFDTEFDKIFPSYTEENIMKVIEGYDVVLPYKFSFEESLYTQYLKYHPAKELKFALEVIQEIYPEYYFEALNFIAFNKMYICLNFIMKKELLEEYMEWMFNLLFAIEKKSDWSQYNQYMTVRVPAFIAERFFNIWLIHNIKKKNLKVLDTTSVLLIGEDYGAEGECKSRQQMYDICVRSPLFRD